MPSIEIFIAFILLIITGPLSGLVVYFKYGIKNSLLEEEQEFLEKGVERTDMELRVPQEPYPTSATSPPAPANNYASAPAQEYSSTGMTGTRANMFVSDPTAFPSWDD